MRVGVPFISNHVGLQGISLVLCQLQVMSRDCKLSYVIRHHYLSEGIY